MFPVLQPEYEGATPSGEIAVNGTRIVFWATSNPVHLYLAQRLAGPGIKTFYLFEDGCVELVMYEKVGPNPFEMDPDDLIGSASYHKTMGGAMQRIADGGELTRPVGL